MSIWTWLGKLFKSIKTDTAKVAVSITEAIQSSLKSGLLPLIADVVDSVFKTHIGEDVLAELNKLTPKILAIELGLVGLPDNPTAEDITAFANKVSEAIAGKDLTGRSKLWTTLSAQIAVMIENQVNNNTALNWATVIADVEQAFQDYKQDLADETAQ